MVNLIAGIASIFIPGLGQVLNGDFAKFIGIWVLLFLAAALTLTIFGAIFGIPMAFIVYVAQVIDAFLAK